RILRLAFALLFVLSASTPAAIVGKPSASMQPHCPPGNLLAAARSVDSLDVEGRYSAITDGFGATEGGQVSADQAIHFLTRAGSLTYDVGAEYSIAAAIIQGDAANSSSLQVSNDGRTYREVWAIPSLIVHGSGFRSRFPLFSETHARFVRFGESTG